MKGIYKITNNINKKVYIGQSVRIRKRWIAEKNSAFNENSESYETYLSRAFRKYGIENFSFQIIEECEQSQLNEREVYWISYYKSNNENFGYNLNPGGSLKKIESYVNLIIQDLKTTTLTNIEIGAKYGLSDQTISDINNGKRWFNENQTYPIRDRKRTVKTLTKNQQHLKDIHKPNKEELQEDFNKYGVNWKNFLLTKYGVCPTTVRRWARLYDVKLPKIEQEIKTPKFKMVVKKVLQYSKEGVFIKEYENAHDAGRGIGNEDARKHILEVCHGTRKTAYGYIWKFKD